MLCILLFILWWHLSSEWSVNDQYAYGWFVPLFALYLFWLRWQDRPGAEVASQTSEVSLPRRSLARRRVVGSQRIVPLAIGLIALLLLLPVRLFEIGNPDWRLLDWIHAILVVSLTGVGIWLVGGKSWLRHFAFPIAFILVAVPWPQPVEAPIIQGLMRLVAASATETLTLFGIPAQLQGNLIQVNSGLVGVNEACSGVRSLQTSLMLGLLFGEVKRLSIPHRVTLVGGAIAIALTANFLRAFLLVWIAAAKGVSEIGRWHDIAGYTIVGLVFLGAFGLAYLLGKSELRSQKSETTSQNSQVSGQWSVVSGRYLAAALCWLLFVEVAAVGWYRAHESNLIPSMRWNVRWPEDAPDFRELKIDDEVRRQLRFNQGRAVLWAWPATDSRESAQPSNSSRITCVLYFFRWNPGRNSALLANLHRPDVCLPAIGWIRIADTGVRNYQVTSSFALPFRHFEFNHGGQDDPARQVAHVFFCLWEDRATNPSAVGPKLSLMSGNHSTWTRAERIRTVLEGRRNLGQQAMEFIALSRPPADSDEIEARFAQALPELVKIEPAK
jgi:exosortase